MNDFEFHNPLTIADACKLLKKYKSSAIPFAGGTDIIPRMYWNLLKPEHLVNIKKIPVLKNINYDTNSGLTIGALVNFNEIIYSDIIKKNYPILIEVASTIASHQVRNLATIGGNICNAAPSADSVPILIALDSTVTIASPTGSERTIELVSFFTGPGKTALKPGEILTQINVPPIQPHTGLVYVKHSTRNALEIAVVGVAGLIQLDDKLDKCLAARIVVGACAPTPVLVSDTERHLVGRAITERDIGDAARAAAGSELVRPISDVRASDWYRREIVEVQCRRVLEEALERAKR